jgi:hypothetical protein
MGRSGIAAALVALGCVGCAGGLGRGRSQFDQGRYSDAKRTFAALESESFRWDRRRRAEYALYRGLTFDALGDTARATSWLREAQASESSRPGTLPPEDLRRLIVAVDGLRPGDASGTGPERWP